MDSAIIGDAISKLGRVDFIFLYVLGSVAI